MIELFIALFGILFYGTKYLGDRASKREYDRKWEISENYRKRIADFEKDTVVSGRFHQDRWSALREISSSLEKVFGENWEGVFRETPFVKSYINQFSVAHFGFGDVWNVAYHIYLAKHGVCMANKYDIIMKIRGVNEPDNSHEISKEVAIAACREIERNIQAIFGADGFRLYQDQFESRKLTWEFFIDSYGGSKGRRLW